jgi:hypothetical protein
MFLVCRLKIAIQGPEMVHEWLPSSAVCIIGEE